MEPRKTLKDAITEESFKMAFDKIKLNPEFAVEGCHYALAYEDLHRPLCDFNRDHYFSDEPVSKSVADIFPYNEELDGIFMAQVRQNLSLVILDDTTGEIVAGGVLIISNRNDKSDERRVKTEGLKKMIGLYNHIMSICNVYDHYNVDEVVHFLRLCVHRDYRQRGIGAKGMKAALAIFENLGIGPVVVTGEGSSEYSKKIYENIGFETLVEVKYEEYKEDGEVVFKTGPDQKSDILYAKVV